MKRSLEEKVAQMEGWKEEKDRYQLAEYGRGCFAYALKPGMEKGEPFHCLCSQCYQRGKKSLLQVVNWAIVCVQLCNALIAERSKPSKNCQIHKEVISGLPHRTPVMKLNSLFPLWRLRHNTACSECVDFFEIYRVLGRFLYFKTTIKYKLTFALTNKRHRCRCTKVRPL